MVHRNLAILACVFATTLALRVSQDAEPGLPVPAAPGPVFYYVNMAKVAGSPLMRAGVRSLREIGKFHGPIVMVTDKEECLVQTLGTEVLGSNPPVHRDENVTIYNSEQGPIHMVKVRPTHIAHNQGFEQHKAYTRGHVAKSKLGFEPNVVVTIDEDILATEPVDRFLVLLEKMSSDTQHPLAVFKDIGSGGGGAYHCGMVVSFKGAEECMQQWLLKDIANEGKHIVEVDPKALRKGVKASPEDEDEGLQVDAVPEDAGEKEEPEEDGLGFSDLDVEGHGQRAFAGTQCAHKKRIALLPHKDFFMFPSPGSMKRKEKKMFIHFTNTYRMKKVLNHKDVQEFIRNEIGLDQDILSARQC